jgi:long-chain acyl-CoA synthetase
MTETTTSTTTKPPATPAAPRSTDEAPGTDRTPTARFVDAIFHHVHGAPEGALLVEMDGPRKVPTSNRALAEMIARARGTLRAQGVAPGDRVVLLAPNASRWAAADLAILAEGAVCVPMYARQAADELAVMMRDAEPRLVLVADAELAVAVQGAWPEAPPVLNFDALFAGDPIDDDRPRPLSPEAPVTIIYTSGTSGLPKGVVLTAGNVDMMLEVTRGALEGLMADRPGARRPTHAPDVVFHYLPFCFAGSRVVLWTCLYRGNPIHVSTDLERIREELPAVRPHYFLNVPTLLERIRNGVEARLAGQPAPVRALYAAGREAYGRLARGGGSLRDRAVFALCQAVVLRKIKAQVGPELVGLICGSAPLGEETQRWFEMIGVPVYQVYGLTETTAIVTIDRPREAVPGRVGFPIDGCEVRLAGEEDELQCRGPNVFPGYWRNEAATRETFTDDGWFRTGDAAEIGDDGNIRIVGRTKNILVLSSGHNVPPEPLEQRLLEALPGAEHVVLFGHGRPHLVAIVTGDGVDEGAVGPAVDALNATLPHYRRIRGFRVRAETLTPESGLVTANLKLRRRALEQHFAPVLEEIYRS